MQETIPLSAIPEREVSREAPRPRSIALLALPLAFLWFILCRQLSDEWSANEQYSYGWFVPFFAAFLFWLRWEDRPLQRGAGNAERGTRRNAWGSSAVFASVVALFLLSLLLPVRLFELGNPDWRPLDWVHAIIVVGLTLILIWQIGGRPWLRHFAFPICFIFIAVPWVSPVEAPIVQGLMRIVAAIASEMLALFGIPAQLEGSVIRISSGAVGVNEACSGVRSLQTSLMIGLLFGELRRLSLTRRIGLVAGAVAIAFVANCIRAFFLVWIASTRGVAAVGQWHDTAGYAILGAVFVGTLALASALAKGKSQKEEGRNTEEVPAVPHSAFRLPRFPGHVLPSSFIILAFSWLLLTEASVSAWYRVHERTLVATPTWSVYWPEGLPGFRKIAIDENVRSTLRFDQGREGAWPIAIGPNESSRPLMCSMFFFRWEPGTTSILRARAHRPDICLPNTGWRLTSDLGVRNYPVDAETKMPFRHFSFAHAAGDGREASAHAFFCEREDRVPQTKAEQFDLTSGSPSDWMRWDRLRVVRDGLRNQGQQVLELVMLTSGPLDDATAESEFAKLVPTIVRVK